MANTTAKPSGTKSECAGSVKKKTGTKTMQIDKVETNAGSATCCAPSRMALTMSLPIAIFLCTFSISTVASSTSMPTANASPPKVIEFTDCPQICNPIMEQNIASGIDVATINVLRQLPKSASIINAVNPAAVTASLITSATHSL